MGAGPSPSFCRIPEACHDKHVSCTTLDPDGKWATQGELDPCIQVDDSYLASDLQYGKLSKPWSWTRKVTDKGLTSTGTHNFSFGTGSAKEQRFGVVVSLPLLANILGFLSDPQDVVRMCCAASKSVRQDAAFIYGRQWKNMYQQRWPVFFEAQNYLAQVRRTQVDWQAAYSHTLNGACMFLLEVFDREKKMGFAMSCMPAKVAWDENKKSYIAHYQSASQTLPEHIPTQEVRRLRFCPASAQARLMPELVPPEASDIYSHRPLRGGNESLKVGQGCELQWKMQMGSPFGWWYGTVESVEPHSNGVTATLTMLFEHFPATSRWYRLRVDVGDGAVRRCAIGGHHAGVRAVTESERKHWMEFFPKEPLVF